MYVQKGWKAGSRLCLHFHQRHRQTGSCGPYVKAGAKEGETGASAGQRGVSMKRLIKEESAGRTSTATKQDSFQHCQMAGFGWAHLDRGLALCFTLYSNWTSTPPELMGFTLTHLLRLRDITPHALLTGRVYTVHVSPPYSAMACVQVQFKVFAWTDKTYMV